MAEEEVSGSSGVDEAPSSDPAAPKGSVEIEKPHGEHRFPHFANFARVSHTPHGFVLTFCYLENDGSGIVEPARIVSRVAMSPSLIPALIQVLATNYMNFQKSFPGAVPQGGVLEMGEVEGPPASTEEEGESDDDARGA